MKIKANEVAVIESLVQSINSAQTKNLVFFSENKLSGNKKCVRYILDHLTSSVNEGRSPEYNFDVFKLVDPVDTHISYIIEQNSEGTFFFTRVVTDHSSGGSKKTVEMKHSDVRVIKDLKKITIKDIRAIEANMRKFDRGIGL